MKLFVLFWLMFRDGADKLYRSARLQLRRLRTLSDVLADLIAFKYRSGEALTDNEIVGLLIALLFAGQHTSSLTSAWAVMLMVSNPTCLHRMLSEQQELLGEQASHKV